MPIRVAGDARRFVVGALVTRCTPHRSGSKTVDPACDRWLVRSTIVQLALQRPIADRMTVRAARMLEHFVDGAPGLCALRLGGDCFLLRCRRTALHHENDEHADRRDQEMDRVLHARRSSSRTGKLRMRFFVNM